MCNLFKIPILISCQKSLTGNLLKTKKKSEDFFNKILLISGEHKYIYIAEIKYDFL